MHTQCKTDIQKRIRVWKANCVSNDLSYKEVIESVEMNYNSVINAMNSSLKGNINAISNKKLRVLEEELTLKMVQKRL